MPVITPPVPDNVRAAGPAAIAAWRQGVEAKMAQGWQWDARYGWLPPGGGMPEQTQDNYGPDYGSRAAGSAPPPPEQQSDHDVGLEWNLGPLGGGGGISYDDDYWDDEEDEMADFGNGQSGAGGAGASYGPSGGEMIPAPGGNGGDYQVQIIGPGGSTPTRTQAIYAIVKTVLENTDIIDALRRYAGLIVRGTPSYQGEPLKNPDVVYLLFEQLTKSQREALVQYAAGVPAPVGLNAAAERDFLGYMVLDAMQAAGISPMAMRDKC